jgi:UDP-2,3-diacylglucosamine hydrolase
MNPVTSLTSMRIDPAPGTKVYFISDVYLGYGTRDYDRIREALLVRLLRRIGDDAAHLFLVGDLFDAWFDYRRVIPRDHVRTLAVLAELRARGLPVTYLIGNHDFGHYTYFRDDLGIPPIGGDVEATITGRRFYVAHGDGKAHNDTGYLILRGILRNGLAQRLYRWLHPDLGIGLASTTSHTSRDYTGAKEYGASDGLRDFALARLAGGYDVVVMGHRHEVRTEEANGGLYVNLGHWLGRTPTFGVYDPLTKRMRVGQVRHFLETDDVRLV